MSDTKNRPAFRLNFCPNIERQGEIKRGQPVEIGAAWALKNGNGFRLSFNVVPQNLSDGVVFLNPLMEQEQAPEREMEPE